MTIHEFAMDQTRLRQVLEFEIREHFPIPLDALSWDHQTLEPRGTCVANSLLTAIKSATAERWLKAAESAGRRVDVLDAGPAALANAHKQSQHRPTHLPRRELESSVAHCGHGIGVWARYQQGQFIGGAPTHAVRT